jgi:hypothetical protein
MENGGLGKNVGICLIGLRKPGNFDHRSPFDFIEDHIQLLDVSLTSWILFGHYQIG